MDLSSERLRRLSTSLAVAAVLILIPGCAVEPVAESTAADSAVAEAAVTAEVPTGTEAHPGQIWAPDGGDHLWIFPESRDELGSGGEFNIYVDPETHPQARASFSRFSLGVGGALPVHRHDKTEEFAYFISGEGVAQLWDDGESREVAVAPGYVWYNPPGEWHSISNTGDELLTLVFATVPNEKQGLLSFFRRIAVNPGEEPPTPLSPEEFGRIAAEHDLVLKPAEPAE